MMFCLIFGLVCLLIGVVMLLWSLGDSKAIDSSVGYIFLEIGVGLFVSSVTVWWFLFGFGQLVIDVHETLKKKENDHNVTEPDEK